MNEQQAPQTLTQAATSTNPAGALQQLLLSRMPTPEQEEWQRQGRQDTLEEYQGALRSDPYQGYSALDHSLYSWIDNIGKSSQPAHAAMRGIAAGGKFMGDRARMLQAGEVAATKAGYEDAKLDGKEDLLALKALSAATRSGGKGAAPTVKMDPDGNMVVYDPASNETKIVHSSQAGAYQRVWAKAYEKASAEGMENPEQYAHGVAGNVLGISPNAVKPIQPGAVKPEGSVSPQIGMQTPGDQAKIAGLQPETFTASVAGMTPEQEQAAIRKMQANLKIKDDVNASPEARARAVEILRSMGGQGPSATPAAPTIAYRDKPAAALAEGEAKGIAAARGKEYEAVQMAGAAAETMLQALNTLEKIKPNTNAAANAQEHIAGLFNALGADPNSPMLLNAIKNREANQILDQLRNASLKAENGVQTKSDEDRIGREFPKTTDFAKAWEFGLKLGKERALRAQERLAYYDSNVAGSSNVGGARSSWNKEYAGDPITQYLGGKLVFRNDFINGYMRKYPDAGREGAVAEWREMEKDYQARGGKK